jgi:hypothetical protein
VPKDASNRSKTLEQLRSIEVYKSEQVVVEWFVKSLSGDTLYGRVDAGRVALTPHKDGLAIYLTEEDIEATVPPLELQEELATLGEIKNPKHITLLLYLLMQADLNAIEVTFQKRGISNDVPEFDAASGKPPPAIDTTTRTHHSNNSSSVSRSDRQLQVATSTQRNSQTPAKD